MTKRQKRKTSTLRALLCVGMAGSLSVFVSLPSHAREMVQYPKVRLQTLDKGTARTMTFDAQVGNTLKFGKIFMRVQSCQKSAPIDEPESAAFLQVWEMSKEQEPVWIFSGWMFASSPALSAMDHPVYDVWVVECIGDEPEIAQQPTEPAPPPAADQAQQEIPPQVEEDILLD